MTLAKGTLIVLDRDGVINQDSADYIKTPAEWQALPGSIEAIARLSQAGLRIALATNQSGLARGLFDEAMLGQIHGKMLAEVEVAGGRIDYIFYCPHGPDDNCDCRKPKPGLLLQAAEHFACGFDHMIMIGDSLRDLQAAAAVGARKLLVKTGNGAKTLAVLEDAAPEAQPDGVYTDLAAAADALLAEGVA